MPSTLEIHGLQVRSFSSLLYILYSYLFLPSSSLRPSPLLQTPCGTVPSLQRPSPRPSATRPTPRKPLTCCTVCCITFFAQYTLTRLTSRVRRVDQGQEQGRTPTRGWRGYQEAKTQYQTQGSQCSQAARVFLHPLPERGP
jgi:hypothetical protein